MAHRPLIGVVPLWDDTLNSLWMLPGYFDGIIEAGGIPVMLPLTDDETTIEQLVSQCDGFLVTGGHDVDPERYGEAAGPKTVKLCKARDRMEERLIPPSSRRTSHCWASAAASRASTSPWVARCGRICRTNIPARSCIMATSRRMTRWSTKCRSRPIRRWPARCGRWETTARVRRRPMRSIPSAGRIIRAPIRWASTVTTIRRFARWARDWNRWPLRRTASWRRSGCRPSVSSGPSNGILSSLTAPIATNVASSAPSSTPADASSRQSRRNVFQEMACPHPQPPTTT